MLSADFLYGFAAFIPFLAAVYQDLREQKIADWTWICMLTLGALVAVFSSATYMLWFIVSVLSAVLLGWVCWRTKIFAEGDALLLLGISAVFPTHTMLFSTHAYYVPILSIYSLCLVGFLAVEGARHFVNIPDKYPFSLVIAPATLTVLYFGDLLYWVRF